MSLFLISGCLLIVVKMIFFGSDIQRRAGLNERAGAVANRHLGRVRTWAQNPNNFYGPSWSAVEAASVADIDQPEFKVTVRTQPQQLYSPCLQAEARFDAPPQDDRRRLTKSYRLVQVDVAWEPASARNHLTLVSLVGAPEVPIHHVELDLSDPGPLAHDALCNITVTAKDSTDTAIPDHFWIWSQIPQGGSGSVGSFQNVTRDGSYGQYQNFYHLGPSGRVYGPAGTVSVSIEGRSTSILNGSNWVTNSTGHALIQNL